MNQLCNQFIQNTNSAQQIAWALICVPRYWIANFVCHFLSLKEPRVAKLVDQDLLRRAYSQEYAEHQQNSSVK